MVLGPRFCARACTHFPSPLAGQGYRIWQRRAFLPLPSGRGRDPARQRWEGEGELPSPSRACGAGPPERLSKGLSPMGRGDIGASVKCNRPALRGRAGRGVARAAHQASRSTPSAHALAALSKLRQHPPPFLPRPFDMRSGGGGAEHKICASPSGFAGTTKKRFDLKRSRFKGAVLSFAAILSLLATAATAADNLPPNSNECASPRASRSAPIVDGHRLQPRACAFATSPDVSKHDARVVDELYRELIGQSATTPPSPPAKDRR